MIRPVAVGYCDIGGQARGAALAGELPRNQDQNAELNACLALVDDLPGPDDDVLVGSQVFLRQCQDVNGGLDPVRLELAGRQSSTAGTIRPAVAIGEISDSAR
jgi:hypothetical protein